MHTIRLSARGKEKQAVLETNFKEEINKGKIINEHLSLVNNFEQSIFVRLFEISKELIGLQKLLLSSNSL